MRNKQWKTKEDFIFYMKQLIKNDNYVFFKDKNFIESIFKDEIIKPITFYYNSLGFPINVNINKELDKHFKKRGGKRFYSMIKNQYVNINIFKKVIDNDILEYFNNFYFDIDIEPHEYEKFLLTVHNIQYFKQSGLSTHKSKYDKEIKQLKKMADKLQYYSKEPIEIILPSLPHFTLSHFIWSSDSNEIIKRYFYNYFNKERYPKIKIVESTLQEASKNYIHNINTNIWEEYFKHKAHENISLLSRLKKD